MIVQTVISLCAVCIYEIKDTSTSSMLHMDAGDGTIFAVRQTHLGDQFEKNVW